MSPCTSAVAYSIQLLSDCEQFTSGQFEDSSLAAVLTASSWVIGEYCDYKAVYDDALDALLRPRFGALNPEQQAAYIHTILKVFAKGAHHFQENSNYQEREQMVRARVQHFTTSMHPEVQERACFLIAILDAAQQLMNEGADVFSGLKSLFASEMKPVGAKAQRKVQIPPGLDLNVPIYIESDLDEDEAVIETNYGVDASEDSWDFLKGREPAGVASMSSEAAQFSPAVQSSTSQFGINDLVAPAAPVERAANDPFMLSGAGSVDTPLTLGANPLGSPPAGGFTFDAALTASGQKKKSKKRSSHSKAKEESGTPAPSLVERVGDDDEDDDDENLDPMNQRLDEPLGKDEVRRLHSLLSAVRTFGLNAFGMV
eukprot:SAG31_NODE_999_length_10457_cov_3.482622_14_plen_371_part_00